ncbi:MAG: metal ABC transporter substrate-binding protein [Patescibacteria group bacterium]
MQRSWAYGLAAAGIAIAAVLIFISQNGVLSFLRGMPVPPASGRITVVATFFPLYDFAREVGKDRIALSLLFTQTPEVASFAPADVQKINSADLVIKNGFGLEPVLDELIAASDNRGVAVADTSAGIPPLGSAGPDAREGADPHVWLNPQNAIIQVGNIRDALTLADPGNADFYRTNAAAFIAEVESLDREIADAVSRFPQKDFVAFHSAFRYFADRYALRQVAVIEEFPGKEPSPRYIAEVMRVIRSTGVRAIFTEPQFSPRVVEVIASDLGLAVSTLDPMETGDPEMDSYLSLMRRNLETLKTAMR